MSVGAQKLSVEDDMAQAALRVFDDWKADPVIWPRKGVSGPSGVFSQLLGLPVLGSTGMGYTSGHAGPNEFLVTEGDGAVGGLVELEQAVARVLKRGGEFVVDQGMITRLHQKDSLRRGIDALLRLKSNISESPEFMSIDMDDALEALGEITGETTPDEVLGQIFESFCIGK
jgi:hypothetical protein